MSTILCVAAKVGRFFPSWRGHAWRILLGLVILSGLACADDLSIRPELQMKRTAEYDYEVPEPGTYALPVMMNAGDGLVLVAEGKRVRLRDLMNDHITVLSFIYTRCPDPRACPMATGALRQLHAFTVADPAMADAVKLATMSFDPAFDTPEVMEAFGKANRLEAAGAPWLFLTAPSKRELHPILEAYGQVIHYRRNDPAQQIKHPVRVYLIDRDQQVRNIYSFGLLDPRMVMTDIRTLLIEAGAPQAIQSELRIGSTPATQRSGDQ